jgi:hypothetical protein
LTVAVGALQTTVICIPSANATATEQVICPRQGTQYYVPSSVQAYLITEAQASLVEAAIGPFDYQYAGGLWVLAFSTVVSLYLISHSIGLVLGFIRRG